MAEDVKPDFQAVLLPGCPPRPGDSRYPYTYAADLLRMAGWEGRGEGISRSEASQIRTVVAKALGMDDDLLAQVPATYFLNNEQALTAEVTRKRGLS